MAIEFKAPSKIKNPNNLPILFEAGSIDEGSAEDWQSQLTDTLSDVSCVILNPRRDDWDSSWTQSIDNKQFREQVEWELDGMEQANLVVLCLTKDSKAPISLLEMGLHAGDGKMIVFCPDGFYRKGNVDVVCKRYGVPVFDDFDEFSEKVKELMSKPIVQSKGERGMVIKAADRIARRMIAREFVIGMRMADVSIGNVQELINYARKNKWIKSMGHHGEMVRQLESNPEYRKIILDADKKHEDPKDMTDKKWFRTMVEISRNYNSKTAGIGYGWGVRYDDELETNEENKPHLELPQFPIQGDDKMTRPIKADATENYVKQVKQVWKLIEELEKRIEMHEKRQEKKPTDYGFAGDMEYVVKELSDLIGFIGSKKAAENTGLALDGMNNVKARRVVNDLIRHYMKELLKDSY